MRIDLKNFAIPYHGFDDNASQWGLVNTWLYIVMIINPIASSEFMNMHIFLVFLLTENTCLADEFKCGDQNCIDVRWHCDGEYDCTDLSDEQDCRKYILLVWGMGERMGWGLALECQHL